MKNQLAIFPNGKRAFATTEQLSRRNPILALLVRLLWASALALPALGAQAGVVFTSLHSFQVLTNGANPQAGLVQGSDGYFYGTTYAGGTNGGNGTVFKISAGGALTSLYSFTGGDDGQGPAARLVQGGDGYLYGTTYGGGTNGGNGTVFKISAGGALTSLYSFSGGNDGWSPNGLVQGNDGYFYGTTYGGGDTQPQDHGYGTVFKISTNGELTTLHSFTGGNDGALPQAGLVQGSDGSFYGSTTGGPPYYGSSPTGYGTVFKISASGTLTTLYSFSGGDDGRAATTGLVRGWDGNFYGTTYSGGTKDNGTVFKISTNGALSSLYSFSGGNDGWAPGGLAQGSGGNFYGTTWSGGTNSYGTVFRISTNGALASLYSFTGGNDGWMPNGLVQGNDGNFYGTTYGSYAGPNFGTVFKISTNGAMSTLYSFTGGDDGYHPEAELVQGNDGNFYGTTFGLQAMDSLLSPGTAFKISANGALTTLYSFGSIPGEYSSLFWRLDGVSPRGGLVQGSDGYFYGTTARGGTNSSGTVFRVSTNGTLTSLYSFTGTNDGAWPQAGLVQGSDGYFYGTTGNGVANDNGTVFKFDTNGTLTTLYSFTGTNDGGNPWARLVQGSDGNFYGTTEGFDGSPNYGTVFKISSTGALTTLHSFTGGNDGGHPQAGVVQGNDGFLYGTTFGGGTNSCGTVFKISTNGALTTLHSFTGTNDGGNPWARLVQGRDGYFYGTTGDGGMYGSPYGGGYGTVFKISTNGALITLYSFTGGNGGAWPEAGLVQGSDGSFYGTTSVGGAGGAGTVFRLTIVPEPQLTLVPSGLNVILTWPTNFTGYALQSTTNLASPVWMTNFPAPVVVNGQNTVTNPISGTQQFFRLAQ